MFPIITEDEKNSLAKPLEDCTEHDLEMRESVMSKLENSINEDKAKVAMIMDECKRKEEEHARKLHSMERDEYNVLQPDELEVIW